MSDNETIAMYDQHSQEYAEKFTKPLTPHEMADVETFLGLIPDQGLILDLGCGPGQWAARFRDTGYQVEATDASAAMAETAKYLHDLTVRVEPFGALDAVSVYDGIWANFSLLHETQSDFPMRLQQIHRALKPQGVFHIGMKLGQGTGRDKLGRYYAYYEQGELTDMIEHAGLTIIRATSGTGSGFAGVSEPYITVTAHA